MFQSLTGTEYLKCEIACLEDKAFEKATWDERLARFNTLDLDDQRMFKKSSNPVGLRAAVEAFKASQRGEETGYMISLDACSSGLQILSLLVSCPQSFSLCGGDSSQCVDSYTAIYESMGVGSKYTRKQVKGAIMTSLYGSLSQPSALFGDDLDTYYDAIETMAPGAWDLNLGLQELWNDVKDATYDWVMPDNFHACIETSDKTIMPFRFLDVEYKLPVTVKTRPHFHKGLGPNSIHSVDGMVVREMYRRCMYNPEAIELIKQIINEDTYDVGNDANKSANMVKTLWKRRLETGFLSARILDHLNEETMGFVDEVEIIALINSLPAKPFKLVSVHDCFRCHPNYGDDLRRQYNTILADINDSSMLVSLASQIAKKPIKARKVGQIVRSVILESNYALA